MIRTDSHFEESKEFRTEDDERQLTISIVEFSLEGSITSKVWLSLAPVGLLI
jgi:hypothetical protein